MGARRSGWRRSLKRGADGGVVDSQGDVAVHLARLNSVQNLLRAPRQSDQVIGTHVQPVANDDLDTRQCLLLIDAMQQDLRWDRIHQPLVAGQTVFVFATGARPADP